MGVNKGHVGCHAGTDVASGASLLAAAIRRCIYDGPRPYVSVIADVGLRRRRHGGWDLGRTGTGGIDGARPAVRSSAAAAADANGRRSWSLKVRQNECRRRGATANPARPAPRVIAESTPRT